MTTPQEKGDALEVAVRAIEELILRTSPGVKEKTYLIESKKIVIRGGVRHEMDLLVTFDLGPGYEPVYIFECKNWKDAVGKNEIIVFAEKISAIGAQRGFFVAKSFTADAVAQASKEPRMELVTAAEYDPRTTIVPFGFHSTFTKPTRIELSLSKLDVPGTKVEKFDPSQAVATLDGSPLNLLEYVNAWTAEAIQESMRTFQSHTLEEGTHQRECTAERKFAEGVLIVNATGIRSAKLTVQFEAYIVRPAVKTHFEINGRGRVISLQAHTLGDATIDEVQFTFGPMLSNAE